MTLGEKIRYLREVEGSLRGLGRPMTQQEIVKAVRRELHAAISQSYLSQIESGARPHQPAVSHPTIHGLRKRPTPKDPSTGPGIVSVALDSSNATVINSGAYELEVLNSTLYYTAYDSDSEQDQIFSANVDGSSPVQLTTSSSFWSELGINVGP